MEFLSTITPYHWIALGLILLTAEMLGAAGFLLGAAIAALAMSLVTWIVPDVSVLWQVGLYALSAVVASVVYFQVFRDAQSKPARPLLNRRASRLIGHQFKLSQAIDLNQAKVQIGDTLWSVETDQPIAEGTLVEVVDVKHMTLMIAAIPSST